MSGSASSCDVSVLQPGMPCIIDVNSVNSPTGLWWGEVIEITEHDRFVTVSAKITRGKFQLGAFSIPIYSDERQGQEPGINYHVYPETATTISLLARVERAQEETRQARNAAAHWRQTHLDTMEHLIRSGATKAEPPKPA